MPLERGTLLNKRYRIVEILGQGGMGSVYRAIDENLGVDLAVKENLFTTEEYSRQFRREATILASLRHPNLPRVTDHFEIENRGQYLIMDYIEGEDLRERMDRDGRLPEDEVAVIGIAICDALTYLHSRRPQVVHRDIKPGNVKIAPDGRIFLVDFGLAKVVQGSQATTTGARAMTPGYSPPEQYGTARTDHRSDIYSLGATLYAALTGVLPEDGLARAMDQADLTAIRKHNSKVSRRLASTIEKALAVQPDARFQSADDLKQAILAGANTNVRKATGELTVTPPPASDEVDEDEIPSNNGFSPENILPHVVDEVDSQGLLRPVNNPVQVASNVRSRPRPNKQNSWGCFLYLLILIILLAGGSGVAYATLPGFRNQVNVLFGPVMPTQIVQVLYTQTPTTKPIEGSSIPEDIVTQTPTLQPTQTNTAESTFTPSPSPTLLTPTLAPTITPTGEFTQEPAFLGNSNGEIAFVSTRTGLPQIWIINVDGVRFRQITDMPGGACQPDWSPDGQRLAFISPCPERQELYLGTQLYAIRADGTGLTALLGSAAGDYDPTWSPDGTRIAFTSLRGLGKPQIYVLNLDDGDIKPLATEGSKNMQPVWSPDGQRIIYVSTQTMGERLWVMDINGENKQPLTDSEIIAGYPDWSSDSDTIVFTRRENIGALPNLEKFSLQNFNALTLVEDSVPRRDAQISPDGLWLVLESWPDGSNHDIWIMSIDGKEARVLVNFPFYDFNPVWRPFVEAP